MKFFSLCLLSFLLFISCSPSTDSDTSAVLNNTTLSRTVDLGYDLPARNPANPYDDAGQIHNELLLTYYYADHQPQDFDTIVSTLTGMANNNLSFMALTKNVPYVFTSQEKVLYLLNHLDSSLTDVLAVSLDHPDAKSSLRDFIQSLLLFCETEEDYHLIHAFIIGYEDSVLNASLWSAEDKRVVLTTTSIVRHSVYARKKRPKKNKDPEWQYLVGNIVASLDGADESMEEAVLRGLVAGVVENL